MGVADRPDQGQQSAHDPYAQEPKGTAQFLRNQSRGGEDADSDDVAHDQEGSGQESHFAEEMLLGGHYPTDLVLGIWEFIGNGDLGSCDLLLDQLTHRLIQCGPVLIIDQMSDHPALGVDREEGREDVHLPERLAGGFIDVGVVELDPVSL